MATREEDLLAAVYEDPASDAPRAVYADWLLDQGHPLGEFIQLQLARAKRRAFGATLAELRRDYEAIKP